MTKKGGVMNSNFQCWNMRRYLRCCCIEPDTIDVVGQIDPTLHYYENEENIRVEFKLGLGVGRGSE